MYPITLLSLVLVADGKEIKTKLFPLKLNGEFEVTSVIHSVIHPFSLPVCQWVGRLGHQLTIGIAVVAIDVVIMYGNTGSEGAGNTWVNDRVVA